MSEKLSLEASLVALQAVALHLDIGSSNAAFVLYKDARPASLAIAADPNNRIVTLTLPKPCTKQINAENIELYPTDIGIAVQSGLITWARLYSSDGKAVADFNVSSNGPIVLTEYDVLLGASIKLNTVTLTPS